MIGSKEGEGQFCSASSPQQEPLAATARLRQLVIPWGRQSAVYFQEQPT